MARMLYCIEHEEMALTEDFPKYGFSGHITTASILGEPYPEIDFCELDLGWATCPPPVYDLDGYIEVHGQPPSPLTEDLEEVYPFWVFDPHTDRMVMEERVQ